MKNFIFLSPNFPESYWRFCAALKKRGMNVLGIGDCPYDELRGELKAALTEYYKVNSLENYDEVYRAVAFFTFRYGRIDWLESNNEYWLEQNARLRDDFNISTGFRSADMPPVKFKSKMKARYEAAGIPVARYRMADDLPACLAFLKEVGRAVVKPDNGVGANATYRIENEAALRAFFAEGHTGYIMEEFIDGTICSYDAIIDGAGQPVFETGNVTPGSLMDVVNEREESCFYIVKELPDEVRAKGRAAVKSFGVKSRFVHFEFFRLNNGKATANQIALQGAIFRLKAQIAFKLQDIAYQADELIAFRNSLVSDMAHKVGELNKDNFAVRQHLRYVEKYSDENNYNALTYEDTLIMGEELAPLIAPDEDEASAVRFDALLYGIELAYLAGKKYARAHSDLIKKVSAIAGVANIPEIMVQSELIDKILHTEYLRTAGIGDFEHIRQSLRGLMKYVPASRNAVYITNFDDEILSTEWRESELENDDLSNYKAKAEFYIRQHQDEQVIAKLRGNIPLNVEDIKSLEKILWNEVGSKDDYEAEYGNKPLGEFVREIVGLDMSAAKEAFSKYLNDAGLDSRQIYFVNQIVEYIVQNGVMKDLSVLQEPPFTDYGSIVDVFKDVSVWMGIRSVINQVNANALAA